MREDFVRTMLVVLIGLVGPALALHACAPKAVDLRVEFARAPDASSSDAGADRD